MTVDELMQVLREAAKAEPYSRIEVVIEERVDNGVGFESYRVPLKGAYLSFTREGGALYVAITTERER